jgi:hypothetical protein
MSPDSNILDHLDSIGVLSLSEYVFWMEMEPFARQKTHNDVSVLNYDLVDHEMASTEETLTASSYTSLETCKFENSPKLKSKCEKKECCDSDPHKFWLSSFGDPGIHPEDFRECLRSGRDKQGVQKYFGQPGCTPNATYISNKIPPNYF